MQGLVPWKAPVNAVWMYKFQKYTWVFYLVVDFEAISLWDIKSAEKRQENIFRVDLIII